MQTINLKQKKSLSRYYVISASLILLLFIIPLSAPAQDTNSIDILRQTGKAFAKIAEKASPAVVGIKTSQTVTQQYSTMPDWPFGDPFDDDFFERFFGRPSPRQQRPPQRKFQQSAQGSGFIVSSDGYILTANHLVGDAEKVMVKQGDNPEVEAKVIGTDPDSDVAVIKIDANKLPFLELADSDALEVGEWVLAIGNPFGLSHTVTAGIVSAKGRSGFRLAEYEDYIQTDAAINPGNSGGPLLNLDGKVVGINTAIISPSGHRYWAGNVGIGFAIPINMAKSIYDQLIETGKVVRGFLGVGIQDLTAEKAPFFGLKQDSKGVLVPEVTEGSAAEKAGLKPGDVIIEFNGRSVETAKELQSRVAAIKPDTDVEIVVLRDGTRKTLTAKLGERPSKEQVARGGTETLEKLGLVVQNLTDDLAERYGYEGLAGVIVTQVEPGSIADLTGITPGALIIEVNRKPVENIKNFNKAIEEAAKEKAVLLRIKQGRAIVFVVLNLPKEKE
ncbi:MAG: DegQ family serine endoprotease [Sedimentisphaerales bacterium]|nr:DegQ family serine endoprotease [Sedimentisphaerales bacterium]